MSDAGFDYETTIKDGMSGPAHHEAEALGELDAALAKNEKALKSHSSAHEEAGKKEKEHGGFLKEFSGNLIPEIALAELAAEGVKKIGEAFVEAGKSVIEFGIEGVKFSLEAAEFKENMVEAFNVVSQTEDEGEKTYAAIEGMAAARHLDIGKTLTAAKELALSGVENEQILSDTVAAQGALQRVGLDAGAEKLKRLVEQSEAAGHLILPKKLGGIGFDMSGLAKSLGETPAQLKADLAAGKIEVDKGIAAIDQAILTGNVGQLAAKKFDLTDVATDWHNIWKQLTEDVNAGPLTGALKDFIGQFSSGQPAFASFKDEIVHDVNFIISALGDVVNYGTHFALSLERSWLDARVGAKPLTDELDRIGATQGVLNGVGLAIRFMADGMLVLAHETASVVTSLAAVGAVGGHVGGIGTGESFVQGLVNSLYAGVPGVHAAGQQLGEAAHEGAKVGIDAHSPSRKAFELGIDYGEGFAMGGEASADRVARAMGDMAMPELPAPAPAGGGTSRTITIEAGAVQIHIESGGQAAEELRSVSLEAGTDLLERIAQELGG
jgi:hypothetical protein